jgi:tyrosyl-tRNA synthetase
MIKAAGLAASVGEANRLIAGQGVKINGELVSDHAVKLTAGVLVVQVGKRRFARVTLT